MVNCGKLTVETTAKNTKQTCSHLVNTFSFFTFSAFTLCLSTNFMFPALYQKQWMPSCGSVQMILLNIRHDVPASVIIQDSWVDKGRPLFLALLHHYKQNAWNISYFKYDSPLHDEEEAFKTLHITPRKMQSDPKVKTADDLLHRWGIIGNDVNHEDQTIVAVDSLSLLLLDLPVGVLCSAISKINQIKNFRFVGLLHGDVHDDQTLKCFKHTVPCHLKTTNSVRKNVCVGTWRKTGGKIIDSEESYLISNNWELTDVQQHKDLTETKAAKPVSAASAVPKSTFRLDLNSVEEKARSQVVLPYIRKQESSSKTGQILYETEGADWDDEDPDDDLEI